MFEFQGIWLPDGEKHFPGWMDKNGEIVDGKGTYQIKKLRAAMEHVKNFRVAVDVGSHIGTWSMQLIKRFHTVYAFEPVEEYRKCWAENMPTLFVGVGGPVAIVYPYALGAHSGRVAMKIPPLDGGIDTGGTHVGGAGDIEMRTLDSFSFQDVDFLKIDCEGYEHHVIEGARETLLRCKPCVIVEQKQRKLSENFGLIGTPAVDLLKSLGAEVRAVLSGDYIMSWS